MYKKIAYVCVLGVLKITIIGTRPAEIDARSVAGYKEGDFIVCKNRKSAITAMAERAVWFVHNSYFFVNRSNYLIRDVPCSVNDFRHLIRRDASKIARLLNAYPSNALDFVMPYEVFLDLC